MNNMKSLYSTAKTRGWNTDIKAYSEAITQLVESNPHDYLLNLEYIISSSIGANSFNEFVEKYGMSVSIYDDVKSILESCIHKCERDGKNHETYDNVMNFIESFRKDHIHEFAMYEWYRNDDMSNYSEKYYSFNENGVQNSKLVAGMIKAFGEAAIPDMIINAKRLGDVEKVTNFIESLEDIQSPVLYEYMSKFVETKGTTLSSILDNMKTRNQQVYRESVITGNENLHYTYTAEEVAAINDMISFKEYALTWAEEFGESVEDYQKEIYSLYEETDGMEFDGETDDTNKNDEDLVPIILLLRHYENDENLPDSVKNNEDFKRSVNLCNVIKAISKGDNYSHAVIGFDEACDEMYSFESMGIIRDSWDSEFWDYTSSIYVSCMFLKKEERDKILKMCRDYAANPKTTQYAYSDLIHLFLGTRRPREDRRFVCSGFVAFLLASSDPKNIHRDYSQIRPEDITILPRAFYVANVKNGADYKKKVPEIHDKIKALEEEHMDELKDYNNHIPKLMLTEEVRKKKFLDKILDSLMGSKLNSRMRDVDDTEGGE